MMYVYTMYCTRNSKIITNKGEMPVEEISKGTLVLNSSGIFEPVMGIERSAYSGEVFCLKTKHFNENIRVLRDFPFYASKGYECKSTQVFCKPGCKHAYAMRKGRKTPNCKFGYKSYKYEAIPVQALGGGDILTYPLFKEVHENSIILKTPEVACRKKLPRLIEITPELMRLFGYYLAEGCYARGKIIFTFHREEHDHINDVLFLCHKYFGLEGKLKPPKKKGKLSMAVVFDSMAFAALILSVFGRLSKHKEIPEWCLYLSQEYLTEFFKGWAYGDGGFKNDSFAVTTINKNFSFMMKLILNKVGVIPYTTFFTTSTGNKVYRLTIAALQLKNLRERTGLQHPNTRMGRKANKYFYVEGGMLHYPIESVTTERYEGYIYRIHGGFYNISYALTA